MNKTYSIHHQKLPSWIDPEQVFTTLFSKSPHSFWLDSSLSNNDSARFSYMGDAPREIHSYFLEDARIAEGDIFYYLKEKLAENMCQPTNLPFPFVGGYVGYFGYELKKLSGAKTKYQSPYPDSLWYFVDQFIAFDHKEKEVYLVSLHENKKWFREIKEKLNNVIARKNDEAISCNTQGIATLPLVARNDFRLTRDKEQYLKDIATCKEYLAKGESYQICLTNTLTTKANIDPLTLYQTLRSINPAPYAAYVKYNDLSILCSSPEQFLKIDKDKLVETKPMKGTIARGKTPHEDKALAKQLQKSTKDWSENAMIVDLLRNDLGKVCEFGSVQVSKQMTLETYETVHTLVSTVRGKLKKEISIIDCIQACFPGGSMTGAPKIRSMEILENLEKNPRGIYSGALGFLSLNQTASLNIVIRTIIAKGNEFSIGAGGAILTDSDPEKEYDEMMLKTKALMEAINKISYTSAMHIVYLALGSNVGDKKEHIENAVTLLGKKIKEITVAKLYETKPMYYENQENFLNTALRGETTLSPEELLQFVKQVEKKVGRKDRFRNGPREIDIDILFYDNLILETNTLQIPHPRIQERDFVLKPFMDLDPNFVHPVLEKTMKELYNQLVFVIPAKAGI